MMRVYLVILFLLLTVENFSQARDIDSLSSRLKTNLHDTDRVKTLNALAWKLMYANPDTAITLSSNALSISEEIEWKIGISNSYNKLGPYHFIKGEYQAALEYFLKALEIEKILDRKYGLSKVLGNIGNVYNVQGDYPRALEYYFKALEMDEKESNTKGIAINSGNIGIVYNKQVEFEKARNYFLEALKLNQKLNRNNGIAQNLGNIGLTYANQGKNSQALRYYLQALKLNKQLNRKSSTALVLGNIGMVFVNEGDSAMNESSMGIDIAIQEKYPEALECFFRALEMNIEIGNRNGEARDLSNIGAMHLKLGKFEKSEKAYKEALAISKELNSKEDLKHHYEGLSALYDTISRPALAFEAYKLFIIYRDSLVNEENTKAQTRTEMKYEYEKAEMVKEQEEREAGRLEAEATSRRDNLQYSIILIALLVFGGLLAVIGRFSMPIRIAEGIIFFSFLIFFEFILVLADPYIEDWSGGAPGIKLLFNAGIAALIFPLHSLFESKLKGRLVGK